MKKHLPTILLISILCIGLSLLLYPSVSDYWNSLHQSRAISEYAEFVSNIDDERYADIWESAVNYNVELAKNGNDWKPSEKQLEAYYNELNISGNGIMGYIEIPDISCVLPIYHGTDEEALQIAVGHIEGSSLPVGGESSHCVISGHRGLPSAKLFSDLDDLKEGDLFMIRTLDETLTYEVDKILIVLPQELDDLKILQGKDLCTLVTCTPYGVNSHRLLVRGHRVANQEIANTVRVTADAMQIEPMIVAPIVAVPILVVLFIAILVKTRKKKR